MSDFLSLTFLFLYFGSNTKFWSNKYIFHMRNHHILFIILGLCCIFLLSCKTTKEKQNPKVKTEGISKKKGEDFDSFYSKFMSDAKFQKSRVTFPLKCNISEPDRNLKIIEANDWIPMKVPISQVDQSIYKVKITKTSTSVTHRIYIENSDTDILLKYKLIKGKWYLTYYKSIFL